MTIYLGQGTQVDFEPNVIQGGSLGATYTLALSASVPQWLVGQLTANLALTVTNLVAGSSAYLILAQNSTGGYGLTINSTSVTVPSSANANFVIQLNTDGTNLYVTLVGGAGSSGVTTIANPTAVTQFLASTNTTSNVGGWGTLVGGPGIQLATGGTTTSPTITFTAQPSLAEVLSNGELTMNLDAGGADSNNFAQTPTTQQLLLCFFRAKNYWTNMQYLTFPVAGTAASGLTAVYGGFYSYDGSSTLTKLDQTAESHSGWSGTYTSHKLALTGGVSSITAGQLYAIGLLQVGTTPASLYGSNGYTDWLFGQSAQAWKCGVLTGQTTLPSSIATSSLTAGPGPWRLLASVTIS